MKSKHLPIGVVFLATGVIALLAALGVIDFRWTVAAHLWPLVLILLGVLILPVGDYLKAALVVVTLVGGVLLYQHDARHSRHHRPWPEMRMFHRHADSRGADDDLRESLAAATFHARADVG